MTESFLHYLWEFQYFHKTSLLTTQGEEIQIFNPGQRNPHSGPDFFQARIKIGEMEWIGSVEIHIQAAGWMEHKHHRDPAYDNVILHVVWTDDKPVKRGDGSLLPTLELKKRVDNQLILHYRKLMHSPAEIPCSGKIQEVNSLIKFSMLDKALAERLESKVMVILKMLRRNNNDWEETSYQLLAKHFGFKVNNDPFEQLSLSLPYKILLKHSDNLVQLEALLFGMGGFLEEEQVDVYYNLLQREYRLLSRKYALYGKTLNKVQWRFLRLRPANFPTLRISQLASLVFHRVNFFSSIIGFESSKALIDFFSINQSVYWQHHYHFFKEFKEEINPIGASSIDNIIINTVVPILAAYGKSKDDQGYVDRAVCILQEIRPESNRITTQWKNLDMSVKTAFDSQAIMELHNNFCLKRRCLDCNIGASLINPRTK